MIRSSGSLVFVLVATWLATASGCTSPAGGAPNPEASPQADFDATIRPILAKYCINCHGGAKPKGDIDLARFQGKIDVAADRPIWEAVLENVESESMPPEKQPEPTAAERKQLTDWVDQALRAADATARHDPGRVTMRRLNRTEYNHTIRDLVGVDFHPADDFPSDDVGYGFDNIGDVLSLPTILLEKYLAAAEKIAGEAIVCEETCRVPVYRVAIDKLESKSQTYYDANTGKVLVTDGELFTKVPVVRDGEYVITVRAYGDQAGSEPAHMVVRLDKHDLGEFDVDAREDAPRDYQVRARFHVGEQRLAIAFTNDFYEPKAPEGRQDRNLHVVSAEIRGPVNLDAVSVPSSHRQFFTCKPGHVHDDHCARETLQRFTTRAFRRPATDEEVDRLLGLLRHARREGESFERGMQVVMQAVLASPYFLFRVETDPPGSSGEAHYLSDYELASRLSYFLWSSMPDDSLLQAARRGNLRQHDVLSGQVRRMLADQKSQALVENFGGQWLQSRNLRVVAPDAQKFPNFDDKLRAAMQTETELFFEAILRENRSILDFIDADFTFLNQRLAKHYGIPGVKGGQFRRVQLEGGRRGGVITQASMLTVTSNPTRTSPVKRGKWILENILGVPPPPPPAVVPELNEEEHVVLSGTLRQRMEQHRSDPNCASCHQRMDPLGFGLENYDGIGTWRDREGKFAIDASGDLPDGKHFDGAADLKALLKRRPDDFARCLAEKMLTYALGRGLEAHDRYHVDQIAAAVKADGYRFDSMIVAIVRSEPFQKRRPAGDKSSGDKP